ncbi:DedA family protein [Galactobacter sp.]|uniref:DedA family protein n=1 Tax=Galactobacter sp. TaxID=2676125 RepID=UPI0025B92846|nr:DedA family protein [Galactobacter sp.]
MSWTDWMHAINDGVLHAAWAWWVLPVVFLLCVIDGFFPVVPSESLLVALSSVWVGRGFLPLVVLVLVGAAGAFVGDQIAFRIGKALGQRRTKWMQRPRVAKVFDAAERQLRRRGAVLIFSARYVPIGRVAVNFTAGATGYSAKRFAFLDGMGCLLWGIYSVSIGALAGNWMEHNRVLGIVLSIAVAIVLGWLLDRLVHTLVMHRYPKALRNALVRADADPEAVAESGPETEDTDGAVKQRPNTTPDGSQNSDAV